MTQAAIADLVGVSRQTLLNWRKQGIDISEENLPALIDRAAGIDERKDTSEEIKAARLRILKAQAQKLEFAMAAERGQYMHETEIRETAGALAGESRRHWDELENLLPVLLDGLTALQMAAAIRVHVRKVLTEICHHAERLEVAEFDDAFRKPD